MGVCEGQRAPPPPLPPGGSSHLTCVLVPGGVSHLAFWGVWCHPTRRPRDGTRTAEPRCARAVSALHTHCIYILLGRADHGLPSTSRPCSSPGTASGGSVCPPFLPSLSAEHLAAATYRAASWPGPMHLPRWPGLSWPVYIYPGSGLPRGLPLTARRCLWPRLALGRACWPRLLARLSPGRGDHTGLHPGAILPRGGEFRRHAWVVVPGTFWRGRLL